MASAGWRRHLSALGALALLFISGSQSASAQKSHHLAEFLFWDSLGDAVGKGVQAHADYRAERQLWRDKIKDAEAELERCGGCASARAELEKWQGIENEFQAVAGALAQASGMPPLVAQWLGIDMPPTSGMTQAQLEERRINRPDWIDDRPEFCRAPSDQFISCVKTIQEQRGLLGDWRRERGPAGECYDTYKLYMHCYKEDYDAFDREVALQSRRSEGEIVAEYTREFLPKAYVYFGKVPDEFVPTFPPPDVILSELADESVREVIYAMYKQGTGNLGGLIVKRFLQAEELPASTCQNYGVRHTEVERRVCDDIYELTARFRRPPVLVCLYTRPGGTQADDHDFKLYWYNKRPVFVEPTRLLPRSHSHSLLQIEDPRTDCAATKGEADQISKTYSVKLANLRSEIPQISGDVILPESEWMRERQKRYEEESEAKRTALMARFPVEGHYSTLTVSKNSNKQVRGRCRVESLGSNQFKFTCNRKGRKPVEVIGTLEGNVIVVHWNSQWGKTRYTYTPKEDHDKLFLLGSDDRKTTLHTLYRLGDLEPKEPQTTKVPSAGNEQTATGGGTASAQEEQQGQRKVVPSELATGGSIEGQYSSKTFPLGGRRHSPSLCKVEKSSSAQYEFTCESEGKVHRATGRVEGDGLVVQWGETHMTYTAEGPDMLLGQDDQNKSLRHLLVRERDLDEAGQTVPAVTSAGPEPGIAEPDGDNAEPGARASARRSEAASQENDTQDAPDAPAGPSVRTTKDVYAPQERITVQFSNGPGNLKDWITVVPQGTPEEITREVKRQYNVRNVFTQRQKEGKRNFPGQADGVYEVRLYSQDTPEIALARYKFRIGAADNRTVGTKD